MTFQYWFMFPISIIIATTAMASGVGGATFFAPLFMLALGLPPEVAIGTGLITEVFGFSSGVYAYVRKRLIDYRLGINLLIFTLPLALVGAWVSGRIDPIVLKLIFGMGLLAIAMSFLRTPTPKEIENLDQGIEDEYGKDKGQRCLVTAGGEEICYTVCNKAEGAFLAGIGGLFVGMISTGLGELNGYFLLRRCKVPSRVSVATSVFVVALTALAGASGHLFQFAKLGSEVMNTVLSIVIFTVPGVMIGGQIGPFISGKISQHTLERGLGALFTLVALITLAEAIL